MRVRECMRSFVCVSCRRSSGDGNTGEHQSRPDGTSIIYIEEAGPA